MTEPMIADDISWDLILGRNEAEEPVVTILDELGNARVVSKNASDEVMRTFPPAVRDRVREMLEHA